MSVRGCGGATARVRQFASARCLAVALLATLSVTGCSELKTPPPTRTFRLAYAPPEPDGAPPLPAVVRVMPFGIAAAYDRQAFIFRTGQYDAGIDHYDRWVASPATMITDLIARDLVASNAVRAVLQSPSALASAYELSGQIETLEERDEDDGRCVAHLRLRALLVRAGRDGRSVAMQQPFLADEPCTRGDPESYVAAMSRATEHVSTEIRSALRDAINADLAQQ